MNPSYPPGPGSGVFGFKHIAALRDDLVGFCGQLQREYGDIVHFHLGPLHAYQFTHPEHIHQVLVSKAKGFGKPQRLKQVFGRFEGSGLVVSDGELWARQRRLVQPAFAPARLQAYAADISACTSELLASWPDTGELDFADEMRRLTLRIIARTLFSTSVEEHFDELRDAVEAIQEWSRRELHRIAATPRWLPLWGQPRARRAIALLDQLAARIILERRAMSLPRPDDLLSHFLKAVDVAGNSPPMSDRQLRDELVTLLLAGHETTAAALTWTVWLLAKHPDVQEQLANTASQAMGNSAATHRNLSSIAPIEQAFKESMRLFPPVYFLSREVVETVEIAGFQLRPKSQVFLVPYLTHRDSRWFPGPDQFNPDRFTPANEAGLPSCAYLPFGAGARSCIGEGLAMLEGTLILSALLQQFRLELASGQDEPRCEWQLTLHPAGGLRLKARRR